jgi:hypothetical protein
MAQGVRFTCDCDGPIHEIDPVTIEHACSNKYAPSTSFYDGVHRFIRHVRVQVNPALTGGTVKFNWFVDWS